MALIAISSLDTVAVRSTAAKPPAVSASSTPEEPLVAKKDEILEVGSDSLFQRLFPNRTTHLFSSHSHSRLKRYSAHALSLKKAFNLIRDLARGRYQLIALAATGKALWNPHQSLFKNLASVARHLHCPVSLAPYLVAWTGHLFKVPMVAYDLRDTMLIAQENFFLFRYVRCFFKREIPQNRWQVFLATTPKNGDVSNIRRQAFFQTAMAKVRPLPLHIGPETYSFSQVSPEEKRVDIFYAGENPKTTVRTDGVPVLRELERLGVVVDMPEERQDEAEFRRRMSRAWLAWSPEGSGWECHRHYEALIYGTVPVINYPTVYRYKPLIDGVHALYYGCEEDDLMRVVLRALEDKAALVRIIASGRSHLERWYSASSVTEYVLRECRLSESSDVLAQ